MDDPKSRPGRAHTRTCGALAALGLLLALLVLATPASAATFTVDTTADGSDLHPGDGFCAADSGPPNCTLRAAVDEANADGGSQTIDVPAGDYVLAQGVLDVSGSGLDLTIAGAGARSVMVDGGGGDRVFQVASGVTATISGLTLTNGRADNTNGFYGGDLINNGTLTLDHVHVTGGHAGSGGGLANEGTMTVTHSLLEANHADIGGSDAGAILNYGNGANGATLDVVDSTIANNTANLIGGISSYNSASNAVTIESSTIVGNDGGTRNDVPNAGGVVISTGTGAATGTIVAGNTALGGPSNCHGTITSNGGNLESGTDCGFTDPSDQQSTDPVLGALADNGGQTDTLLPAAGSPAIDRGLASCPSPDQRDVARPQGGACDVGAVEVVPTPPSSTGSPSPQPTPPPGTAPVAAPSSGPPPPVFGQSFVGGPVSGVILVKRPGSNQFVVLAANESLPVGTIVDATRGVMHLVSARDSSGAQQSGNFYGGVFQVGQGSGATAALAAAPVVPTELRLVGRLDCPAASRRAASHRRPAAFTGRRRHTTRHLWGDAHGNFRTRGSYSAATVRGTKWLVSDTCTATRTTVARGVVAVRDFVRHRTVLVRAGHSYLARAPSAAAASRRARRLRAQARRGARFTG